MATPPRLRRLSIEDFSSLAPEVRKGVERLVTAINPFLSDVAGAFERRLTWDNFASVVRTVEVQVPALAPGGSPQDVYTFDVPVACPDLPGVAANVLVTRAEDITSSPVSCVAPNVAWENAQGQERGVVLRAFSGLTAGRRYRLRLLITL